MLREANDKTSLPIEQTAVIRGQIKAITELLALPVSVSQGPALDDVGDGELPA